MHAERLENGPFVHRWIGLVWGVEQQPASLTDRSNGFDPRLSAGVWEFDIRDLAEIERLLATDGRSHGRSSPGRTRRGRARPLERKKSCLSTIAILAIGELRSIGEEGGGEEEVSTVQELEGNEKKPENINANPEI